MLQIEIQTLPAKGRPATTYCTFEISPNTTVAEFVVLATEKAGKEIRLDGPNVVKGLRKFKLTGQPEQLIREALTLVSTTDPSSDAALAEDLGQRYVAELKNYETLSNSNKLSMQDGIGHWSIAGLSAEAEDEDEGNAFRRADGTWDRQRLVDALLSGAACAGDADGVREAVRRGAQVDSQPYGAVHAGTALHMALNAEVAALLLEAGAELNADAGLGGLPLTRAIRFGRLDTASFLIQSGAKLEFTIAGKPDCALRFVGFAAHLDDTQRERLVERLLQHKADVNFQDCDGWTPLMEASLQKQAGVSRLLLDAGADVNTVAAAGPNNWGPVTALDVCQKDGSPELAAELIARGAKRAEE